VLYDASSSWLEGRCCELARFGYSRDGKKGKWQIVYGLLCAADGCPVAVEVFKPAPVQAGGNPADPMTHASAGVRGYDRRRLMRSRRRRDGP
jgi:hypothetical protein